MNKRTKAPVIGFILLLLSYANLSLAANSYSPDMLELNGTNGLYFEGQPAFDLNNVGTIELWVAADWNSDPGYDPVMLSNLGSGKPNYVLSILGDRSGLSLQTDSFLADLPFDFSDNLIHHIVLINLDTGMMVVVDGKPIGEFVAEIPKSNTTALWVGSAYNDTSTFKGAIGGLRFWDIPVKRKSLVEYALQDVLNSEVLHPDINALLAVSDFRNQTIIITDVTDDTVVDTNTEETAQ